jgi:hypothetical protein
MSDLSLVTTDSLLEELERRFDDMVFAGTVNRTNDRQFRQSFWNGCSLPCAGLAAELQQKILRDMEADEADYE